MGKKLNKEGEKSSIWQTEASFHGVTHRERLVGNSGLEIPLSLKHSWKWKDTSPLAICVFLEKHAELNVTANNWWSFTFQNSNWPIWYSYEDSLKNLYLIIICPRIASNLPAHCLPTQLHKEYYLYVRIGSIWQYSTFFQNFLRKNSKSKIIWGRK